ncbi:MAG TPA: hypothetical protein VHD36_00175 [Pirellulales bacterium]|nr:hypothetical protein [Pirellulales bacterium]
MLFYVANGNGHALVPASSEMEARDIGSIMLGAEVTIVRAATAEEIAVSGWHDEMMRRQAEG